MNRLYVALLASAALSSFAVAQNRGNEHFGGLTLDVPLAVTSGGLGNATGNASTLTVLPSGATTIQTLAKALSRISDVRFYGPGGAAVDQPRRHALERDADRDRRDDCCRHDKCLCQFTIYTPYRQQ